MWEEKVVDGPHLTQDIPMISIETLLDYSNVHIIPHPIRGMYPQVGLQTCTNLLGHLGMFFQFFPCREAPRIVKSWEERPKFPGFDQRPRGGSKQYTDAGSHHCAHLEALDHLHMVLKLISGFNAGQNRQGQNQPKKRGLEGIKFYFQYSVHMYIYIYVYIYMCIYMCIYILINVYYHKLRM